MPKKQLKIFWKVFFMTMAILCFMIVIAYMLLYLLLPDFYKNYKTEQYENITKSFITQLKKTSSFDEETKLLSKFAVQYGVDLELQNTKNELLYDFHQSNDIVTNLDSTEFAGNGIGGSIEVTGNTTQASQNIQLSYTYTPKKENKRRLTIMVPLQPLNEAKDVIVGIYPVACIICIVFALIFAFVFSKIYITPIKQIRILTGKMANLEENIEIPVYSSDEIGELSQDINHLYTELKGTIDALSAKIQNYSDAENRKIGFLRTVSHELKTPLAATIALIEGMIYEIPPYNTSQKQYLSECKQFLEQAVELIKESLSLSKAEYDEQVTACNMEELIHDVTCDYMMIIHSRQITYMQDIPSDFFIETRAGLLKKALSNIISNAVNYTPNNGRICISYEKKTGILAIENTCVPLSQTELSKMFEPFYSGENNHALSNGLGLSIVKQLLGMLHIKYAFVPMENGEGMCFKIYLSTKDLHLTQKKVY